MNAVGIDVSKEKSMMAFSTVFTYWSSMDRRSSPQYTVLVRLVSTSSEPRMVILYSST